MKIDAIKLKVLRQKQGWTQEDLAERANVHPRTVQRSEAFSFVSRRTIKSFADALGVEASDFSVSTQIPFGAAIVLNSIIGATVMILIAIKFQHKPVGYESIQNILFSADASSLLLFIWLPGTAGNQARYKRYSQGKPI